VGDALPMPGGTKSFGKNTTLFVRYASSIIAALDEYALFFPWQEISVMLMQPCARNM